MLTETLIKAKKFCNVICIVGFASLASACSSFGVSKNEVDEDKLSCEVKIYKKDSKKFKVTCSNGRSVVVDSGYSKSVQNLIRSGVLFDISPGAMKDYVSQIEATENVLNYLLRDVPITQSDGSLLPANGCLKRFECERIISSFHGKQEFEITLHARSYSIIATISPNGFFYDYMIH
jgi:hypothetical protein